MAKFEFFLWLARWLLHKEDFEFIWDEGNSTKSLRKHGVSTEVAEEVFCNKDMLVPLGVQITPTVDEPRFGVLGMNLSGKRLSICFAIRDGKIRIISIRPMSRKERKRYEETLRKE